MTLVVAVWGGKDGFRKQTQMGFCSKKTHRQAVGMEGYRHARSPERGAPKDRGRFLHRRWDKR